GAGTDESQDSRRDQRPDRDEWPENGRGHYWWPAQSGGVAGVVRSADSEEQSGAAACGTGRDLEGRAPLCPAPSLRAVAVLSKEDRRVRPSHRRSAQGGG